VILVVDIVEECISGTILVFEIFMKLCRILGLIYVIEVTLLKIDLKFQKHKSESLLLELHFSHIRRPNTVLGNL